jgi:hypothetical protein
MSEVQELGSIQELAEELGLVDGQKRFAMRTPADMITVRLLNTNRPAQNIPD